MKMTRGEIQDLLVQFATRSHEYRDALIEDPRSLVAEQFRMELPEEHEIKIVEEDATTCYVVLPPECVAELSDEDLESVVGGFLDKTSHCDEEHLLRGARTAAATVVEINASLF